MLYRLSSISEKIPAPAYEIKSVPAKNGHTCFSRFFIYSVALPIILSFCSLMPVRSSAQLYKLDRSTEQELSEDRKPWETKACRFFSNTTNDISLAVPLSLLVAGTIMDRK